MEVVTGIALALGALILFRGKGKQIVRTTGYRNRHPFPLDVEKVDGVWMSAHVARRFERMRDAAGRVGVRLVPNSGFRTMEEQTAFYLMTPEEKKKRGIGALVAEPGTSIHQSGDAIDIETDHEKPIAAQIILPWLRTHASDFGFVNTISSEPWHYETLA